MAEYTLTHTGEEIDSAVTRANSNVSKGSITQPVYFDSNGIATAITSYDGNAATSTKATQDANGNVITSTYARKINRVTSEMDSTKWTSNTYSFEAEYPQATYNIEIELAPTATTAQAKVFGKAIITGNATTNVVTALGTVPTVNIPIIITYQEK